MLTKIRDYLYEKQLLPYIAYILMWFIVQWFCFPRGDDVGARNRFLEIGWLQYYIEHHQFGGWSSRFIINFIGVISLQFIPMWVWRIMNTSIMGLLLYSVNVMFNVEKKEINLWLGVVSVFFCNYTAQATAGWMVTTITYLWSAVFAVYAISVMWRIVRHGTVKWYSLVLAGAAGIYAVDSELGCVFMIIVGGAFCVCFLAERVKKQYSGYMIFMELFFIARCILHLFWARGGSRLNLETITWFPEFQSLSYIEKIQIGVTTTCYQLFHDIPVPLFVLTLLMCTGIFYKYQDCFHRGVSLIPVVLIGVEGIGDTIVHNSFQGLAFIDRQYDATRGLINRSNYWSPTGYITLFLWLLALLSIFITVLSLSETEREAILYVALLFGGILSRMVMGFSPTVFGSYTRTSTCMYIGIVLCIAGFLLKLDIQKNKGHMHIATLVVILGVLSFVDTFYCIVAWQGL